MKQYLELIDRILEHGQVREDRTGTGTVGVFGHQMRFDLADGFPLVTTKRVFLRGIIEELLWFLRGETNIQSLLDKDVHIWDDWATEKGEIGPLYGAQWRDWKGKVYSNYHTELSRVQHDQISDLIEGLKNKPFSRRHIVSAWNVEDLPDESKSPQENARMGKMALAPCHCFFQFYVQDILEGGKPVIDQRSGRPMRKLSCQLYQRSTDAAIGLPFNIASYALLTMMVAQCVDMMPGEFIHTSGDTHVYLNHVETLSQVQLKRTPFALPQLKILTDCKDIFGFQATDFELVNYQHHPAVAYKIAV